MSGIYVDWRLSENGVGMGALYFSPLFGAYLCLAFQMPFTLELLEKAVHPLDVL